MSDFCSACGIPWVEGKGFVEPHKPLCANARHGWNFTVSMQDMIRDQGARDVHPVDALKLFAQQCGMEFPPEAEARMRAICDEEVFACGCSVAEGHKVACKQEAQVTAG